MDGIIVAIGLWAIGTAVTGMVWGLRLEGKVKTQEAVSQAQREEIIHRLDRIERKIDANGKNHAT